MKMRNPRLAAGVAIVLSAGALSAGLGWAAQVASVSQKDRAFNPKVLEIARGDTIRVNNDDGELVHHAYIKSDTFNFDSGEQAPASHVDITIPVAGTFTVRCMIHPKMHLVVTVR